MLVFLLSLSVVWGCRMVMFQLSGFYFFCRIWLVECTISGGAVVICSFPRPELIGQFGNRGWDL